MFGLVAAEEVEAGEFHGVEDAGRFARDLRHLVDDGLGAIERCGVGQLRERDARSRDPASAESRRARL